MAVAASESRDAARRRAWGNEVFRLGFRLGVVEDMIVPRGRDTTKAFHAIFDAVLAPGCALLAVCVLTLSLGWVYSFTKDLHS